MAADNSDRPLSLSPAKIGILWIKSISGIPDLIPPIPSLVKGGEGEEAP
jgi:hypothetical protein